MYLKSLSLTICVLIIFSCSKKDELIYEPSKKLDPYVLYKEGQKAFEKNDFFFASKKFSEAELNFSNTELAAKSAIMSCYSLYAINFYTQAEENIKRYLSTYAADKNVIYAHYLLAIIYYEQIGDEKKDLQPLLKSKKQINFFINEFPDSEYTIDLKFKMDLIENQLAAKELFVARYYSSVQKWVPAINRLKVILNKYEKTIFVEEALHRLVEIHYHLGFEKEANKYAAILGYNYNTSEWFKQSYKILNKDYDIKKSLSKEKKSKVDKNLFEKIINLIK
jgi:outer membrane protein assembly factor BamD